ncbi:28S ribosomal protein S9, mitochondrial [Aphidius gifuensis]|uniref:28S ribosomal protein S9, mitochondrial n=1 Tax=Aphidius gifuensis TaxID=684658 RepID=UPI001CDCA021|nr:28S ribosomal protein S9, mitochondrial [Aphidius gifuensis]
MALTVSCGFFIRSNVYRNVIKNIGNTCSSTSYLTQQNNVILRFSSVSVDINHVINEGEPKQQKKLSKAMKAYLQRAKEHDEFIHKETQEYLIGKRHLANMMGLDPNSFTQKDVNAAIQYLFPSGIFDPRARPIMDEPEKIHPKKKAAEFDIEGRPFSSLFYTTRPNYYQALYDIVEAMEKSNELEDAEIRKGLAANETNQVNLIGSDWVNKEELEKRFLEPMNDKEYEYFIASAERLTEHPYSAHAKDLLMKFREIKKVQTEGLMITPLEYNEQGRPFIVVKDCQRKSSTGTVKIWGNGTGLININGKDITYFYDKYHREQKG